MANEKVKVKFKEKRLDKDGRHSETTVTKSVPAKARKYFEKWGWQEVKGKEKAEEGGGDNK